MEVTREEFKVIVAALKSNYRTFGIDTKQQFEFWLSMLEDLEYQVVEVAARKLVSESPYPPTIADIRKAAADVVSPELPSSADAWGEVVQAMKKFGSYNAEKALKSLSPLTRKAVKIMGFRELCVSENQMADRAHFLKMYKVLEQREKTERVLSLPLKENIKQIQGKQQIESKVKLLSEKMGSFDFEKRDNYAG
ncbi:replicative helicase loader/inhibitor [Crassaminicella profunda]|uniref:replicative helicase loader/inhibitor n=1 Tax=Crassaminicella profunda TaxID=1286698 RepID=UPI001CA6AF86|nr:replicative helicase loader/inhibitor [Crassaminicella profunda]QZY56685.1 hypothetical protein K7H06_07125 [Crassaminicella profunda]